MTPPLESQHLGHPSDCGCSLEWRNPKPNGTCATCGGWLPGERTTLPWATWPEPEEDLYREAIPTKEETR